MVGIEIIQNCILQDMFMLHNLLWELFYYLIKTSCMRLITKIKFIYFVIRKRDKTFRSTLILKIVFIKNNFNDKLKTIVHLRLLLHKTFIRYYTLYYVVNLNLIDVIMNIKSVLNFSYFLLFKYDLIIKFLKQTIFLKLHLLL